MMTSEPPPGGEPYYGGSTNEPVPGQPYPAYGDAYDSPQYQPQYPAQGQPYPQAPPPAYPPQPYPYPMAYAPPRPTNGMAIASMVLGILWLYWVGSVLALIFGYIARKEIQRTGASGDGMAIAGIVLGWVGIGILCVVLIVVTATVWTR